MREMFTSLRAGPFRRLLLSRTVSLVGDSMAPVALAFAVLAMPNGSAAGLGAVLAARSLAQIAFFLGGGVLADRLPRKQLMIGAELLAASSQACAATLVIGGDARIPELAALAAVNGAAAATFMPTVHGTLPTIVSADRLRSANALLRLTMGVSTIVGSLLASVLVAALGPGYALLADAGTFLASALLLVGIRVPAPVRHDRRTFLADLGHGWREFRTRRWVWVVVAQFAVLNACVDGGIRVLGPVVADERLGGATAWSLILATQATGRLVGSFLAMRIGPRRPLFVAVNLAFGFVPPFVLLAVGAPAVVVAFATLISGVCGTVFSVLWSTALQTHVPNDILSRITSYDLLGSYALGPIGLSLVGWAAAAFGTEQVLLLCAGLCALATIAALSTQDIRREPVEARAG